MNGFPCNDGKLIVIVSNMFNERHQIDAWMQMAKTIAGDRIIIVDTGSTDGTIWRARQLGAMVIVDPAAGWRRADQS